MDPARTVAAAIDGEATTLDPPLTFAVLAGALRLRIAAHHPGLSPSARLPLRLREVVPMLVAIAAGHPNRFSG